jgi:hypothetical protein
VHFLVLPYKPCLCRHSSLVRPNSLISANYSKYRTPFVSHAPASRYFVCLTIKWLPSAFYYQTHTTYMCPAPPPTKQKTKCCTHTEHQMKLFISFTGAYSPGWTFGLPFQGFLITHIQTHGRTPLDGWSARRRGLYLHRTTHITQQTNIHSPSGIRTRDPSNQAAADLRLRPRGHWNR